MKSRSLVLVGTSAVFLGLLARMLGSVNDFALGFSAALQIAGTAVLLTEIVKHFDKERRLTRRTRAALTRDTLSH